MIADKLGKLFKIIEEIYMITTAISCLGIAVHATFIKHDPKIALLSLAIAFILAKLHQ